MRDTSKAFLLCFIVTFLSACGASDEPTIEPQPAAAAREVTQSRPSVATQPAATTISGGSGVFVLLDPATSTALAKPRNVCSLERVNGTRAKESKMVAVAANDNIEFNGWIVDPLKQVPDGFVIVLSGDKVYGLNGVAGRKREDVARSLMSEDATNAGFQVKGGLGDVAAGTYSVSFLQENEGVVSSCNAHLDLVVGG